MVAGGRYFQKSLCDSDMFCDCSLFLEDTNDIIIIKQKYKEKSWKFGKLFSNNLWSLWTWFCNNVSRVTVWHNIYYNIVWHHLQFCYSNWTSSYQELNYFKMWIEFWGYSLSSRSTIVRPLGFIIKLGWYIKIKSLKFLIYYLTLFYI